MSPAAAGASVRRIPRRCSAAGAAYKQSCAMCHGEDRAGTPAAPSLVTIGSQIGMPQFRRIILFGNGRMPPIGHIDEEQIADILAFLGGGARAPAATICLQA